MQDLKTYSPNIYGGVGDDAILAFGREWNTRNPDSQITGPIKRSTDGLYVVNIRSKSDPLALVQALWAELNPDSNAVFEYTQELVLSSCPKSGSV